MSRPTWDRTWLALAALMAQRSRCHTGVGAVLVSQTQRVVATGYAGPPADYLSPEQERGGDCKEFCERPWKEGPLRDPGYLDCPSVHAEVNTLLHADRSRAEGGTLYVSSAVCFTCAKVVANSGVVRVVWPQTPEGSYRNAQRSVDFLSRCAIAVDTLSLHPLGC